MRFLKPTTVVCVAVLFSRGLAAIAYEEPGAKLKAIASEQIEKKSEQDRRFDFSGFLAKHNLDKRQKTVLLRVISKQLENLCRESSTLAAEPRIKWNDQIATVFTSAEQHKKINAFISEIEQFRATRIITVRSITLGANKDTSDRIKTLKLAPNPEDVRAPARHIKMQGDISQLGGILSLVEPESKFDIATSTFLELASANDEAQDSMIIPNYQQRQFSLDFAEEKTPYWQGVRFSIPQPSQIVGQYQTEVSLQMINNGSLAKVEKLKGLSLRKTTTGFQLNTDQIAMFSCTNRESVLDQTLFAIFGLEFEALERENELNAKNEAIGLMIDCIESSRKER